MADSGNSAVASDALGTPPLKSPIDSPISSEPSVTSLPSVPTPPQTYPGSTHAASASLTGFEYNSATATLDRLAGQTNQVIASRTGSVLARGFILKSDYRLQPQSGTAEGTLRTAEGAHLRGAPNFRGTELGVYGVAQPTTTGLKTILTVLSSQPSSAKAGVPGAPQSNPSGATSPGVTSQDAALSGAATPAGQSGPSGPSPPPSLPGEVPPAAPRETVWFCTREEPIIYIGSHPFVLRDAAKPTKTYSISDRAENLEGIEKRLKQDILTESRRYGGLVLVHEERNGQVQSTWVTVDSVATVREVWDAAAADGYNVRYFRVPVARDQSPEDRYLHAYATILRNVPTSSALVFNCGVGVVRTTFSMCAALIIRRRQLMRDQIADPYAIADLTEDLSLKTTNKHVLRFLNLRTEQSQRDRSLLRLMYVLQNTLHPTGAPEGILTLLGTEPKLLENLRKALVGQYDLILSLMSCLDDGRDHKKLVDCIVDECGAVVNLKEVVLQNRLRYSMAALMNEESDRESWTSAVSALERYFFLIAFSAYVADTDESFQSSFSAWIAQRSEISNMISRLRRAHHFDVFAPVTDLSSFAKVEAGQLMVPSMSAKAGFDSVMFRGGAMIGDELAKHIVLNRGGVMLRAGMILKGDRWHVSKDAGERIRGAINFRRVADTNLYALSQPTEKGIERVLDHIADAEQFTHRDKIVWVNLREEPLIYINGIPYVLRQDSGSLRNVKSYVGISSERLEVLESRLKKDILAELDAFGGRLLVHTETEDGTVVPVWETIDGRSVRTLREVMDCAQAGLRGRAARAGGAADGTRTDVPEFEYQRIPVTAEKAPDFSDCRELIRVVTDVQSFDGSAIVVNCQLGRGRSTRAQVIMYLVQRWIARSQGDTRPVRKSTRPSYTVINNLLRTLRNGAEIKSLVDEAITACGATFDLLDAVEEAREAAAAATGATQAALVRRGLHHLRAYFFFLLFAAFLAESHLDTLRDVQSTVSYEEYVKSRPVYRTIERELDTTDPAALTPLQPGAAPRAGDDEAAHFVATRAGTILSQFTLLKSDYFAGLQKMSLPDRIDGSPNYRRVPLLFGNAAFENESGEWDREEGDAPYVYGTGMPTVAGLRNALDRMGARPAPASSTAEANGVEAHGAKANGVHSASSPCTILWTSMREEPVIYIAGGRPHVLRLFHAPLENVITTGITTNDVEIQEELLKKDLLRERAQNGGRVLLHDEILGADGTFTVTAEWTDVDEDDIMTPQEVFARMRAEGYAIDYERLPVTDEQSPIPGVYTRIEDRVSRALQTAPGPASVGLVFNCQMGRGRTTTGMVAACLVANIRFADLQLADAGEPPAPYHNLSWDGRESDPFLEGEYKIILQLVGVLPHGKLAKRITDRAIDKLEGVQNLRRAIYDYKLRLETCEVGSDKYKKTFEVGMNYLYRYGTLIAFAEHLLEKANFLQGSTILTPASELSSLHLDSGPPFATWLSHRREITHVLSMKGFD